MDYVWGYTLVNDMCSDSWKTVALRGEDESRMHEDITIFTQRAATSYYSRSTDSFAAIGPWIVTKEDVPDPYNLMVWNRLRRGPARAGLHAGDGETVSSGPSRSCPASSCSGPA